MISIIRSGLINNNPIEWPHTASKSIYSMFAETFSLREIYDNRQYLPDVYYTWEDILVGIFSVRMDDSSKEYISKNPLILIYIIKKMIICEPTAITTEALDYINSSMKILIGLGFMNEIKQLLKTKRNNNQVITRYLLNIVLMQMNIRIPRFMENYSCKIYSDNRLIRIFTGNWQENQPVCNIYMVKKVSSKIKVIDNWYILYVQPSCPAEIPVRFYVCKQYNLLDGSNIQKHVDSHHGFNQLMKFYFYHRKLTPGVKYLEIYKISELICKHAFGKGKSRLSLFFV